MHGISLFALLMTNSETMIKVDPTNRPWFTRSLFSFSRTPLLKNNMSGVLLVVTCLTKAQNFIFSEAASNTCSLPSSCVRIDLLTELSHAPWSRLPTHPFQSWHNFQVYLRLNTYLHSHSQSHLKDEPTRGPWPRLEIQGAWTETII